MFRVFTLLSSLRCRVFFLVVEVFTLLSFFFLSLLRVFDAVEGFTLFWVLRC